MSGLEIVGIAASIIQIADLGATLSIKLCEFYRQVKSASQSLHSLSSDVALTCNILRELGETLKQDEQTKLCSIGAFDTAQEALRECESVFTQIRNAIEAQAQEQDPSRNRLYRAFRKVGIALIERDLNTLRGNLDRLRSTMLLLLNVIMYAGQVRSNAGTVILQQQREIINTLMKEKRANDERFYQLRQAAQTAGSGMYVLSVLENKEPISDENPPELEQFSEKVRQYYLLVKALFAHIDAYKSTIELYQHLRIRNGIARINSEEVSYLASRHGPKVHELFSGPYFQPSGPSIMYDMDMPSRVPVNRKQRAARERLTPRMSMPQAWEHRTASRIGPQRTREGESSDGLLKKNNVETPVSSGNDPLDEAPIVEVPDSPLPFALEDFASRRADSEAKGENNSNYLKRTYTNDDDDDACRNDRNDTQQHLWPHAAASSFLSEPDSDPPEAESRLRISVKKGKRVGSTVQEAITESSDSSDDSIRRCRRGGPIWGKKRDIDNRERGSCGIYDFILTTEDEFGSKPWMILGILLALLSFAIRKRLQL